jgi:hypothetical protein
MVFVFVGSTLTVTHSESTKKYGGIGVYHDNIYNGDKF